jgi:hypothetical protein
MLGASTGDKIDLKTSSGWLPGYVTDYRITRFFNGSNQKALNRRRTQSKKKEI